MNTPAHLLVGAAAFARSSKGASPSAAVTAAALTGGLLPDLSLYIMGGVALFWLQLPPQVVFAELYFSESWQRIFAIDNSFIIWGMLLGLSVWRRSEWMVALAGAGVLHLLLDFPLHHHDGRAHFWPVTDWIFASPFSYWDREHHAGWIAPLEGLLAAGSTLILLARFSTLPARLAWTALMLAELWAIKSYLTF